MPIQKIKCFLGLHDRVYFSQEYCDKNNLMSGLFIPWKCSSCGEESMKFPLTNMTMPKVRVHPLEGGAVYLAGGSMRPYQQRVVDEKMDLDEKAKALSDFIGYSNTFGILEQEEQELLKEQCEIMWQYSEILGERIRRFLAQDLKGGGVEDTLSCPNCGSKDFSPKLCPQCGGNGDTGAPLELTCTLCDGAGVTDLWECEDCEEVFPS